MLNVWRYRDARDAEQTGVFVKFSDRGGTDVSYYFHRLDADGRVMPEGTARLDIVNGARLKLANRIGAMPEGGTFKA